MADNDGDDDDEDGDGSDMGDDDCDGGDEGDDDIEGWDDGNEVYDDNDSDKGDEGGNGDVLANNGQGVNTNSTSEGLGNIHPPYGCIITNCITYVFRITTPNNWQSLLIHSTLFNKNANKLRELCISRNGDGKNLLIQCAATMMRYVTIVIDLCYLLV